MASKPNPLTYSTETFSASLHNTKPPITFDPLAWESLTKERLLADSFGYVWGSAGTRQTDDNNRAAFKKWSIVPSRLAKADFTNLKTTLFGDEYEYPLALAPVGVQTIFHRDGETAAAKAAGEESVTYILSTATSTSLENVAKANKCGPRWYQLYWPSNEHHDITTSLLKRAKENGYKVLVVTLDTYMLGWRPSDLDNGYNPFLRNDNIGVEIGFSDPVFRKRFREKHGAEVEEDVEKAAQEISAFLRKHWDRPIVLKGIQTVADAKRAVKAGVHGIVVSNHGGRQQDGGVGSLEVLPEIVDAVGQNIEVLFDSGVMCGADIVKALALGANMVLMGRPYVYGLAIGGQEGVRHVIRSLLGDLQLTLHLSEIPEISSEKLNRDVLRRIL
ncbi:FMN-dependent dehydrogenase [Aspergillus spinulosporus]